MNNDEFKSEYEQVVMIYSKKLFLYSKTLCKNHHHAEEIVQETLLTGFQYFGSLNDKQKIFPWLKTIAKRIYFRKFKISAHDLAVSIDEPVADTLIDSGADIEHGFIRDELYWHILNEIDELAQKQRDSIIFRYVCGLSVKQTASALGMTGNSVKVSSHTGLEKVKERLKDYFIKGDYIMDCKEAYAYLFQYAKGQISAREKEDIEKHINVCKECRDIVSSLFDLTKHITPAQEKEHRNYVVYFQLSEYLLEYVSVNMEVDDYQEVNAKIEEWGEDIPFESIYQKFPSFGFTFTQVDFARELLAEFGDGGFRLLFEEFERNERAINYRYTKMNKLCNPHDLALVFISRERKLKPSVEHPDLIYGYVQNWARRKNGGKIGVYLAVPSGGENLRIKQGDGIIDCGAYKFVYADRHVLENENVAVNCSYIQ